jgi:hypothetical protein
MQIKKLSILSSVVLATSIGAASACPTITNDEVNQIILQQANGHEAIDDVKGWFAKIDWYHIGPPRTNNRSLPSNFKPDTIKIDSIKPVPVSPFASEGDYKYCEYEIHYNIDTHEKAYIAKLFLGHP